MNHSKAAAKGRAVSPNPGHSAAARLECPADVCLAQSGIAHGTVQDLWHDIIAGQILFCADQLRPALRILLKILHLHPTSQDPEVVGQNLIHKHLILPSALSKHSLQKRTNLIPCSNKARDFQGCFAAFQQPHNLF